MNRRFIKSTFIVAGAAGLMFLITAVFSQALVQGQGNGQGHSEVSKAVYHDVSSPLRDIKPNPESENKPAPENPIRLLTPTGSTSQPDTAVQKVATRGALTASNIILN